MTTVTQTGTDGVTTTTETPTGTTTTTETETTTTTPNELPPPPPNDAPENVKAAFEDAVNIYGGGYDDYVPAGSTVTVAQRRTLVAAVSALQFVPALQPKARRRK